MPLVSTTVKRAWLDDAYDASVAAGSTLRAQLRSWETTSRQSIASGQVIASTSSGSVAGNRSVSFSAPNLEGFSPVGVLELVRELIDLHDEVLSNLSLTDSTANRSAIKVEMMALLVPCREGENDYSQLRTGQDPAV